MVGGVDADDPAALIEAPQREALAAAFGSHLLRQRERRVLGDGAEQQADVAGELGAFGAGGQIPDAQGIVLGPRGGDGGGAIRRERDGQDVALVAMAGEARDGLSLDDVPDANGPVAVTAAGERAGAVAGDGEADRGRGVPGQRPQQPRASGGGGRGGRGRLALGGLGRSTRPRRAGGRPPERRAAHPAQQAADAGGDHHHRDGGGGHGASGHSTTMRNRFDLNLSGWVIFSVAVGPPTVTA
jgi:hypothetical protein